MEMEQENVSMSPLKLEDLTVNAFHHLEELGYSPHTAQQYWGVWRRFASSTGSALFSEEAVNRFLESEGLSGNTLGKPSLATPDRKYIASAMHVLYQYALEGVIRSHHHVRKIKIPENFEAILQQYRTHCLINRRYSLSTIHKRIFYGSKLLTFFSNRGGTGLNEITVEQLSEFIKSQQHLKPVTLKGIISSLKSFLGYLWVTGILTEDLSPTLPKICFARDAHIPTVWSCEEMTKILSAVDRCSPKGKRDYAILLLASRLGLRSMDIRKLCLENIQWEESQIEIIQSKTKTPLVLPLMEEVGQSLIDYLRHGRPKSPYREVFLRVRPPFEPLSNAALWIMINFYRRRAGVTCPKTGHGGLHSLRHTLASRLLEERTPIETISSVLGHTSIESTNIYLKVGIEALRSAALNPDRMTTEGEVDHA